MVTREDLGLPPEAPEVEVGSIRHGGSEYRVRIVEGERGSMIDFREYVLPPTPESQRAYVPKGKGRGRVQKDPFTGFTRKGMRFDVETWGTVVALIVGAMTQAEGEA